MSKCRTYLVYYIDKNPCIILEEAMDRVTNGRILTCEDRLDQERGFVRSELALD